MACSRAERAQKGNCTICVKFKHMPAAEVRQCQKDYGFDCKASWKAIAAVGGTIALAGPD